VKRLLLTALGVFGAGAVVAIGALFALGVLPGALRPPPTPGAIAIATAPPAPTPSAPAPPAPQLAPTHPPATYVGAATCAGCHAAQMRDWQGSDHAMAMAPATPATVRGDFAAARLTHFGVTTTFHRDGDRFLVRTEGPDGAEHEYEIAYTFGVDPLQQYLVAFPGGRLQPLPIAWDTRPRAEGGQRWFHLYPDERLNPGERIHWTGRDQTWNRMCADCHSTGLVRNHDLATDSYATRWTDVNVACESCHGPGSRHVAWAQGPPAQRAADTRMGIVAWLAATDGGTWRMDEASGIARRSAPLASGELDSCGGCHARRKPLLSPVVPGTAFLDGYSPSLLDPGLYHADGQIDGEVFEWGSFVQSRMHRAGVTCSNCHEPHSQRLRAEGNAICTQCHLPARFDVAEHHHHAPGSAGAQCANCHMAPNTYMGVDVRRDHSFRVPRPDLSLAIGVPNACTTCHTDRDAAWAQRSVAAWFPQGRHTTPHFGLALHAGRTGARDAERRLDALVRDRDQPGIARATAMVLLGRTLSPASLGALRVAVVDPDPLVRSAAPRALPAPPPAPLTQLVAPLLSDPVRLVRIEAARALAAADPLAIPEPHRTALAPALRELEAAEMADSDAPESHVNLGLVHLRRRDPAAAEAAYRTALRLDPAFVPALVNLADLYRARGREGDATAMLRDAVSREPANAEARFAFGLALARARDLPGALAELRRAQALAPDNARHAYVLAIALNDTGAREEALLLLDATHRRHPADREVLLALVALARDAGQDARAVAHARDLVALDPGNLEYRRMLTDLQQRLPASPPRP
jgi:predicted CXXCH cytochrome family protein